MLKTEDGFWNNLNASFWNLFYSDKGQDIWDQGTAIWQANVMYANAQRYLGLIILGYISYKTFK